MGSTNRQQLPSTLTVARASRVLKIKASRLRALISAGLVWTVWLDGIEVVPISEVARFSGLQREIGRRR